MLLLGWSMGIYLIFSQYIYEYRSFIETVYCMSYGLFGQRQEFKDFIEDNKDLSYLGVTGLLLNFGHLLLTVIFLSMAVFLFKTAAAYEREQGIRTPDKDLLHKEIKQIRDQVNQIYLVKVKGTDNKEAEVQFKNTKIVAWLLNRNQNSMKKDRDAFFRRVNELMQLASQQEQENMQGKTNPQGPNIYI